MLLTALQVNQAMTLNSEGVRQALLTGGYDDDSIKGVYFEGMNEDGQFVYCTKFIDNISGDENMGRVFIKYIQAFDSHGANPSYVLVGDY